MWNRPLYPMMLESPELRWAFIRKIYAILTVQMLTAVAAVVVSVRPISDFFVSSGVPSSIGQDRIIIVANQLPVRARRRSNGRGWSFSWDEDSLLLQLKDGLSDDMEVIYVGSLHVDVKGHEQDNVSQALLERFSVTTAPRCC